MQLPKSEMSDVAKETDCFLAFFIKVGKNLREVQ
jgi:hypothetical protein